MTEYYKNNLEDALEYQDFISDELRKRGIFVGIYSSRKYQQDKGESQAGIEIKYDKKMAETHNVYIETQEKSDPANLVWVPSGIYRKDNTWLYVIGDYENAYFFSKPQLVKLIESEEKRKQHGMIQVMCKRKTSIGYTYPIEKALATGVCIKHIKFSEGDKNNA